MTLSVLHVYQPAPAREAEMLLGGLVTEQARLGLRPEIVAIRLPGAREMALGGEAIDAAAPADPRIALRLREAAARHGPDLVHLHSHVADVFGAALAFSSAPVVSSRHGEPPGHWLAGKGLRAVLALHSHLLADSEHVARRLLEHDGFRPDRVTVVRPGLDVEAPGPERRWELRKRWGLPAEALLFGAAGPFEPERGLDSLLEAWARWAESGLPEETRLVLCGSGSQEAALRARIAKFRLENRIFIAPQEPGAAAALDVVVVPSLHSELGVGALTAMAAGKPLVVTDTDVLPELVAPGVTGLVVPPSNPVLLMRALAELAGERGRLEEMGRMARLRQQTYFRAERMAAETAAVYERTLAAARSGS